ncbi:hypothetical protein [Psychrobacillus sp. FSL K6-2843]
MKKGIAEGFWDGVRIRREKALDSPYNLYKQYWLRLLQGYE